MKCKACGKKFEVESVVRANLKAYGKQVLIASSCCGAPYYVVPVFSVKVEPCYDSTKTEDDWGSRIKRQHVRPSLYDTQGVVK